MNESPCRRGTNSKVKTGLRKRSQQKRGMKKYDIENKSSPVARRKRSILAAFIATKGLERWKANIAFIGTFSKLFWRRKWEMTSFVGGSCSWGGVVRAQARGIWRTSCTQSRRRRSSARHGIDNSNLCKQSTCSWGAASVSRPLHRCWIRDADRWRRHGRRC